MRHEPLVRPNAQTSLIARRRFQLAGALVLAALLPYVFRSLTTPGAAGDPPNVNAMYGNAAAVVFAMWVRLSIATYPGIRSSSIIFPAALAAHGTVIVLFLMTRLPYDRLALSGGFVIHVLWNYAAWFLGERRIRQRIAIVPFGSAPSLTAIEAVDWLTLKTPTLAETAACSAIVADFAAEMPDEWEMFLADAALAGRIVYQVKQLSESLTGRVELKHLSENSFGSLLPARGYFHLKSLADFLVAVALLPVALPMMGLVALAIKLEDKGDILFRQVRTGHAGRGIRVYKFRTMKPIEVEDERQAAITGKGDERITPGGAFLRRWRVDELSQIFHAVE